MTFEVFKEQLMKEVEQTHWLSSKRKTNMLKCLRGRTRNSVNDDYHNFATSYALHLLRDGEISFKEYSEFYSKLNNYF